MIASYFQQQTELASKESRLHCPDDCSAPGCWMADVIVEVNIFDLIRLSLNLNTPVPGLFQRHCRLGFQIYEPNPRYQRLLIKLKKPCDFLQAARCTVHGSKPLNCVLFPEYHQIIGQIPELKRNPTFRNFSCLKKNIDVSEPRSTVLKKLKYMSSQEEALSSYILFETPALLIDTKPLLKQIKKNNPKAQAIIGQDRDRLLSEALKPTGLLDGIKDKIIQLETRADMAGLFEKLWDDAFMQPLLDKMISPEIVYKLAGNDLKPIKRRIQPLDVIFR
jgi:Fe-S-cluster containining protein